MAGWFLFVKMKHNVDTCHIFVTQKESWIIDTCHQCNVVHFIIILYLLGLGTQNMGSKEMYFQNFDYENCYFLHRKLKLNEREKSQSKFQLKGIIFSDGKITYHHSIEYYIFVCSIHHYLFYVYHRDHIVCISSSFLCSFFLKNCLHNP